MVAGWRHQRYAQHMEGSTATTLSVGPNSANVVLCGWLHCVAYQTTVSFRICYIGTYELTQEYALLLEQKL